MNTYQMENPEAFTAEYEEEQRILAELARPEEVDIEVCDVPEGDIFDIVRQYEEGLTDEQRDELNREREAEWMKFYDSGVDFPYEQ